MSRLTPSISIDSQRSAELSDAEDESMPATGLKAEKRGRRRGLGKWLRSLGGSSGSNSRDPSPTGTGSYGKSRGRRSSSSSAVANGVRSRSPSAERGISAAESSEGEESEGPDVVPNNAYEDEGTDSDYDSDSEVYKNTEANAGEKTVDEVLDLQSPTEAHGDLPNLIRRAIAHGPFPSPTTTRRRTKSGSEKDPGTLPMPLDIGKPVFERNRCSIVLTHGDPQHASETAKRTRTYFVASDLSEESQYAIEWAIGTVLRDGDDLLIVSVIETDSKLDPEDAHASAAEKRAKIANQRERQDTALVIQRIATSLLERTRLHVRVTCQAVHASNPRHMLIDMIDYIEPTMVIIGSRGLSKIKGMLLGSVSHYLVQKSSVPVMVARRRLRRPTPGGHRHRSSLDHTPRVRSLANAEIEKISHGGAVDEATLRETAAEDAPPAKS